MYFSPGHNLYSDFSDNEAEERAVRDQRGTLGWKVVKLVLVAWKTMYWKEMRKFYAIPEIKILHVTYQMNESEMLFLIIPKPSNHC